jgi:hypothetical protein
MNNIRIFPSEPQGVLNFLRFRGKLSAKTAMGYGQSGIFV